MPHKRLMQVTITHVEDDQDENVITVFADVPVATGEVISFGFALDDFGLQTGHRLEDVLREYATLRATQKR